MRAALCLVCSAPLLLLLLLPRPSASLTAHIISHSHCDPGWLESFEGYYSSQVAGILSSVVAALDAEPTRRFIWAEMSFWMRWYEVQPAATQALVLRLVRSGQLEFVGGGWVQNDEANPDFAAVIAQISEGHEYLKTLFGVRARFAWQIDPFGHAAAFAAVAAASGFEALVINRIDHTVKDALKARAALEFEWQPYSPAAAASAVAPQAVDSRYGMLATNSTAEDYSRASLFTHVLHTHYSAPRGFDFENPEGVAVSEHNVAQRASLLVSELRSRSRAYRTSHLLVPFGDDFKFQDAGRQFRSMDQLVRYVNAANTGGEFADVTLRYSTLSDYFDAVFAEAGCLHKGGAGGGCSVPVPLYAPRSESDGGADFFPYADNQNSWWTGYYSSRPQLKGAIRRTTSLLRGADALLALVRPWASEWQRAAGRALSDAFGAADARPPSSAAERGAKQQAVSAAPYALFSWLRAFQRVEQVRLDAALCLHHDAITGTSRDGVVTDYTRRMAEGNEDARALIADVASLVLGGLPRNVASGSSLREGATLSPAPLTYVRHVVPIADSLTVSVTREVAGAREGSFVIAASTPAEPIVVFNAASWRRTQVVSVLVDVGSDAAATDAPPCRGSQWPFALVSDGEGRVVASQLLAVVEEPGAAQALHGAFRKRSADAPAACAARSACGRPLLPLVEEPAPEWAFAGVRFELVFLADVEPLSLSTFFVSVAWSGVAEEEGGAAGGRDADASACGAANALARRLGASTPPTAVLVPGLRPPAPSAACDDGAAAAAVRGARLLAAPVSAALPVVLENSCLRVEVDASTGLITFLTRKHAEGGDEGAGAGAGGDGVAVRVAVRQGFSAYQTGQSGAYIFRPAGEPQPFDQHVPPLGAAAAGEEPEPDFGEGRSRLVTVSVTTELGGEAQPLLVQVLRVVGPRWGQTLRLANSLGWSRGAAAPDVEGGQAARCSDPALPDGALEVVPTALFAQGNQEVVMTLDVALDVAAPPQPGCGARSGDEASTNARDHWPGAAAPQPAAAAAAAGGGGACAPPSGWWTSDGLGLLRRRAAPLGTPAGDLARHFYPLNTLARLAGPVATLEPPGKPEAAGAQATAWLSLYTQQPFGAMVRETAGDGGAGRGAGPPESGARASRHARLEVMLHRHLSQDDGRGLSTGVVDLTRISPALLVTLGAAVAARRPPPGQHLDWAWRWATQAALHVQPLVTLHADLDVAAAAAAAAAGAPAAASLRPPQDDTRRRVVPPLDLAVGLGVDRAPGPAGSYGGAFGGGDGEGPRFRTVGGSGEYAVVLAEAALPVAAWTSRFATSFSGLGGAAGPPLPQWVSVATLQARDAVTDDVVLRLQNLGGPAVRVDVSRLVAGAGSLLAARQVRPRRSLSMSIDVGAGGGLGAAAFASEPVGVAAAAAAAAVRARYPAAALPLYAALRADPTLLRLQTANALHALGKQHATALLNGGEALDTLLGAGAPAALEAPAAPPLASPALPGSAANQNTAEEGVFISDAALEKANAGRLLLEIPAGPRALSQSAAPGHVVLLPPRSFASFLLTLEATPPLASMAPPVARVTPPPATAEAAPAAEEAEDARLRREQEELIVVAAARGGLSPSERARMQAAVRGGGSGLAAVDVRRLRRIVQAQAQSQGASVEGATAPAPAAPARAPALPRDPWEKRFLEAEARDFFDELRRGSPTKPPHDHDAAPVRLDFVESGGPASGGSVFSVLAVAGLLLWLASIALLAGLLLRCSRSVRAVGAGRGGSVRRGTPVLPTTREGAGGLFSSWSASALKRASANAKIV